MLSVVYLAGATKMFPWLLSSSKSDVWQEADVAGSKMQLQVRSTRRSSAEVSFQIVYASRVLACGVSFKAEQSFCMERFQH